jgi:hypothetical protein
MSLDAFYLQCSGILAADELQDLENMVHHHLSECRTAFGRTWSAINTQMDNEMAALRAQKWQIQTPWTHLHPGFSLEVSRFVHEAFSRETPLETEWTLDQGRWKLSEGLISPERPLGLERILAFGIQLKLMHRWAALDADTGREQMNKLLERLIKNIMPGGQSSP